MTNPSVLSASEAVRFLEWLDPTGLHNLVAIDPVTKAVEAFSFKAPITDSVVDWIDARNGRVNLYFSINEPSGDAREGTKLRRDEIGAIRAFHVDIDNLEGEPDWDMDCLPSAIIDSGGGRWGFWKLAVPFGLGPDWPTVADIEAQNRALTARFHGDGQAHNIDRIARLPGTLNIPNEAKRKKGRVETVSRILSLTGMTYEPAEVASWCPPLAVGNADVIAKADQAPLADLDAPASVARATRYLLLDAPEAVEGSGGDETTYRVAARLKDFGVSREVAFDLLLDSWNETKAVPPWPAAELRDKVRNAYNHGTAAPGRNAANLAETEFEAVETLAPLKPKGGMEAESFDEITEDFTLAPNYLIEDWYDKEAMVVTYGESNSGKTHVALDQSLAIAAGRTWAGKKTQPGLVVYVAAEGGKGVRRRIMAHRIFRPEHKNLPFALVRFPINLMRAGADTKALLALVKDRETHFGQKCVMVVVDTLSRALAGGDENSSADMGAFVKRCDEIRAATGATLHIIHHAGKNTAKGARGHSLLRAAVDTEIEIEGQAVIGRKQRDMEISQDLRFDYKPVVIGTRPDGTEIKSVVLDVWAQTEFDLAMTPQTEKVLGAIESLIMQKTQNPKDPKTFGVSNRKTQQNQRNENPKVTLAEVRGLGFPSTTVDRAVTELLGFRILAKSKRGLYELNRNPKTP